MAINYLAVFAGAVLSMVLGIIWYGPLFGRKWLEVIGATDKDLEARRKMQESAAPLYAAQFLLAVFQVWVLAYLIQGRGLPWLATALLVWGGFILPTVAASAMWNNDASRVKWARFWIQAGYQLLNFLAYGLILGYWR